MKLGVMQPYFMPYIGYFSLIKHTDQWVIFDTAQYIKKGWINRNRIMSKSAKGFSYINVPVAKQPLETPIKDTLIALIPGWKKKIMGQLAYYKGKAPFYNETIRLVENIFEKECRTISEINTISLITICKHLNISFKYQLFSKDTMGIKSVNTPDEWALEICKKTGATEYINPPGGRSFFDKNKYLTAGINLRFIIPNLVPYKSIDGAYIPGLSILDVLMFNDLGKVHEMLDSFEIE